MEFRYLTIDEGLSNNKIRDFSQDSLGYIWIATENGLNKYNGYEIVNYMHDPSDTNTILSNNVYSVFTDSKSNVWIGSEMGLNIYNRGKDNFLTFVPSGINYEILLVKDITEDKHGTVWIGTLNGLCSYNLNTKKFQHYTPEKNIGLKPDNNQISKVLIDDNNKIWCSFYSFGISIFDPGTGIFRNFMNEPGNPLSLSGEQIYQIYQDSKDNIWIGDLNTGLNLFNPADSTFIRITIDEFSSFSTRVRAIFEDENNNLYFGTRGGIYLFNETTNNFSHVSHTHHPHSILNMNSIMCSFKDNQGGLWIGTFSGGVNYTDLYQKPFFNYQAKIDNPYFLNDGDVFAIIEDNNGNLYIGTEGGMSFLNRKTGRFTYYEHDPDDPNSISYNDIKCLELDNNNNIWIGTNNGGLLQFNPKTGQFINKFTQDKNNSNTISDNKVYDLFKDKYGNLWIINRSGRNKNIDIYNPGNGKFNHKSQKASSGFFGNEDYIFIGAYQGFWKYTYANDSFTFYKNDSLIGFTYSIIEDSKKNIWIGSDKGLVCYNPDKDTFKLYSVKNHYPFYEIYGILEDSEQNLWISSNAGLIKFQNAVNNNASKTYTVYDLQDGLQSKQFNYGASYKSSTGEMFFGGIKGFNSFFPEQIKNNPFYPEVVLTKLKINNKTVRIGEEINGRIVLNEAFDETKKITLLPKDINVSIEFTALHYAQPKKIKYAYRLEGFDPEDAEWNYTGADNRIATYTNLNGGEYIFKVKASNNDGVWNENPTILKITVLPPFWKTWWFITIVIIVIMLSAASIYYIRVNALKKQKQVLEQTVNERTADLKNANTDLKRQKETISTLSEFGQKITATINLYSINNMIFDYVSSLMDTTNFGISVYNSKTKSLFFPSMMENGKALPQFNSMLTDKTSCAVWCYLNQKVIFSNNFHSEYKKYIEKLNIRTSKIPGSLIYIPLIVENKRIGVLTVQSNRKNAYTQHDYNILQTLASYIAIALDNANIYQLLEVKNTQLEQQTISLNETNTLLEERQQKIEEQSEELMVQQEELIKVNNNLKELNSTKDKFFSIIAHDIKNPFQVVLGYSELLKKRYKTLVEKKKVKYIDAIYTSSKTLFKLLDNLLEWSRAQTKSIKFTPTNFPLNDIVNDNIKLLQENINNKKIEVLFDNNEEIEVFADRDMINTVIRNILLNAIKFTGTKGKILVTFFKENETNGICIKDTGSGMKQEDIQKLFRIDQNFIRKGTDGEIGTGLGLLICKEFINIHSGKIWAESEIGKGSAFYFTIPKTRVMQ